MSIREQRERGRRIDVTLLTGGRFHDFDFARLQLLTLLAEHDEFRVRVQPDYEDAEAIAGGEILVSYTCDVRPSEPTQRAIREWVERGGRWVALHGTNAALDLTGADGVESPREFPLWANTLGTQFIAHPPIQPYRVEVAARVPHEHQWLVDGVEPFETDDELYLSEYHDRDQLIPLLQTTWQGEATGFVDVDWTSTEPTHLVVYYPRVERCSWQLPEFHELLRRSLRWARPPG